MTESLSQLRGRAALGPRHRMRLHPPPRSGRAAASCPISNAAVASTPPSCAPRWRRPSAPPMPTAPGTGRPPTTPARRRRSCSCASTARAMRAKRGVAGRHAADAREDREPSPDPHAALRGKPGAPAVLDADRAWLASPASPPRSRPPIVVLEPSAGTGLLAILAELAGGSLVLNELAETRAGIARPALSRRRRHALRRRADRRPSRCRHRAERRADEPAVLGGGACRSAAWRTRRCAMSLPRWRVSAEGGRLVAITGANFAPDNPAWRDAFVRLQERGRVVFSAAIDGAVYAKHGTTIDTRLTVIDKRAGRRSDASFPASPGIAPDAADVARLGDASMCRRVARSPAPRRQSCRQSPASRDPANGPRLRRHAPVRPRPALLEPEATEARLRDRRLDAAGGRPHHRCAL